MPGDQQEHRALRWDGTVTAGNLLTAVAMCAALLVWGIRLEGRVDSTERRTERLEQARDRDDRETQSLVAQLAGLSATLAAIREDQRAMRALLEQRARP
jgi:septal ring factor EnvC (AmiA/AmiB activator)